MLPSPLAQAVEPATQNNADRRCFASERNVLRPLFSAKDGAPQLLFVHPFAVDGQSVGRVRGRVLDEFLESSWCTIPTDSASRFRPTRVHDSDLFACTIPTDSDSREWVVVPTDSVGRDSDRLDRLSASRLLSVRQPTRPQSLRVFRSVGMVAAYLLDCRRDCRETRNHRACSTHALDQETTVDFEPVQRPIDFDARP